VHEECADEILPSEYQKIIDALRKSEGLSDAIKLFDELKTIENRIKNYLESIKKQRTYMLPSAQGECCPISQLKVLTEAHIE
jgi:hypothetical protein